jgi:biotin carboxylase
VPPSDHQPTSDLPLLMVVHGSPTFGVFDLAEAASGTCRLAFMIDGDPSLCRLLRRLGPTVDITGLDEGEALLKARELAPDGIITFADPHLARTAALAQGLGLPYHSPDVARKLGHKYEQRRALERAGLPGPRIIRIEPGESWPASRNLDLRFPVVVKPDAGTGSRQTSFAYDTAEVREATTRAQAVGVTSMVIEEYLPDSPAVMESDYASFVSVESIAGGGTIRHLAVVGKFPLAVPFRETGHFVPSHLPPEIVTEILEVVTMALTGIGVVIGNVHTEVKLTPEGPRVIEVNGRTAGAIPAVLALASGYFLLESAMTVALGGAPAAGGLLPCDRIGFRVNLQPPTWATRLDSIEGVDAAKALRGVESVEVLRASGDPVDWQLGTDELVAAVIGSVESLEELREIRHQIDKTVKVKYAGIEAPGRSQPPSARRRVSSR